jgi:MYXO-CTERM domain-containing protein
LTGLAFDMPGSYDILSGTVKINGSTVIGNVNPIPAGGDVSGEWGYHNGVSGHFNGLAVDTQVSTMEADTSVKFSNTPIDDPAGLNGPEYGLLGGAGEDPGGLAAIKSSVIIELTLNGTPNGGFLNSINGGIVAVTYGSPTGVPEPTSAIAGLLALAGLGFLARRRK